jgi:hypothetical protein
VTLTDDDGVEVTIAEEPQRIVTFAPSMTEIVCAHGVGDRLVGVAGPFDDFPAEAKRIRQVGGAGEFGVDPNLEDVVALEPDLFLTIAGGDPWKEQLRELGVTVVTLNATDFDDLLDDIGKVGLVTGSVGGAETLVAEMARPRPLRRSPRTATASSRCSSVRPSRRWARTPSSTTSSSGRGATRSRPMPRATIRSGRWTTSSPTGLCTWRPPESASSGGDADRPASPASRRSQRQRRLVDSTR